MAESKIGTGEVELHLPGEALVLKPTLRAALEVSRRLNGFLEADRRLSALDLDAVITVISAGLGPDVKDVGEKVFATGVNTLVVPAITFVGYLANGGKAFDSSEETKKANPPVAG